MIQFPLTDQCLPKEAVIAKGFEPVAQAFGKLYENNKELGGAVSIYRHGKAVIDLWHGWADLDRTISWQHNTVVNTFSVCKAMTALCLLHLIDQDKADLSDPVVKYWPEFASVDCERKKQITLKILLQHRAGLPAPKNCKVGDVFNWQAMIRSLEQAYLLWPDERKSAYHAVTFGHLVGEIIRRISGLMPSEYFQLYIAEPLEADYALRFMPNMSDRAASTTGFTLQSRITTEIASRFIPFLGNWKTKYYAPCNRNYHPNSDQWRASEAPSISGFGTAHGLARIYDMLAGGGSSNGVQIFSPKLVKQISTLPNMTKEMATETDVRIGLGMFFNHGMLANFGPGDLSFGHAGMGGSTAFADPVAQIGFAFVCNRIHKPSKSDPSMFGNRAQQLIEALYDCLKKV